MQSTKFVNDFISTESLFETCYFRSVTENSNGWPFQLPLEVQTHTLTRSHHPVLLSSSIQLHLHQVIHPHWLEAAAPSGTLIPSVLGYEKQTAGLAQTSRSLVLKPERFLKTNKLLPELGTQGFYEALKLPFFLCREAPRSQFQNTD